MGKNSVNIQPFPMDKNENCIVCNARPIPIELSKSTSVEELLKLLSEKFNVQNLTLVTDQGYYLHAANPVELYEAHCHKLQFTLGKLIEDGFLQREKLIHLYSKSINNEILLKPEYV